MKVKLIAHTQVTPDFWKGIIQESWNDFVHDGQLIALTAIRTCYSSNKPSEIVAKEGSKYFGSIATDGQVGSDADRLIRHIIKSGHTSTLEHISFTFALEGVSRSLLAQLTRHRHLSFSVQSQRYVKLESDSKSGGFEYVIPNSIQADEDIVADFAGFIEDIQQFYDDLRARGIKAEDARYILPNAATTNLVMSGNLRTLLDFYSKRASKQAQWEIRELAEHIKGQVINVEPWTEPFFKVGD